MTSRSLGSLQTIARYWRLRCASGAAAVAGFVDAERDSLPLWLPAAFGAGIATWFLVPFEAQRLAAAALVLGLAAAAMLLGWRLAWLPLLMLLAGMGAAGFRSAQVAHPVLAMRSVVTLTAAVESIERRPDRDVTRLVLAVASPQGLPGHVRLTVRGGVAAAIAPGARLRVRAALVPPATAPLPGGYDFARRAWFAGIGATGYPLGPLVLVAPAPPPGNLEATMAAARGRLTEHVRDRVPGAAGAVTAAFVTGDQGAIPLATAQAMRDAGLAHLLSISGLHIAVVVGGVMWLVRRGLALVPGLTLALPLKGIAIAVAAVAGLAYTLLAGAEVPTVRSILATLIVLLGVVVGREALSLRMLATAALLILAVRPEALMGASFQLSFAAVTGIVALYESRLGRWLSRRDEDDRWFHRAGRGLAALLVTGLVAEAALAPIGLFHFNKAGVFGALANLVAIPWSSFVVMPLIGLALVADAFGTALFWPPVGAAMAALIDLADAAAALPGAVLLAAMMPVAAFAGLVAGGLWLALWRTAPRRWGLLPIAAGLAIAVLAPVPDLFVSGDGRHVGVVRPGGLAMLRPRASDFLRSMWGNAAGTDDSAPLPGARCSADACLADIDAGGRTWRVLLTISRDFVAREAFEPACAAADIVVSDRRLPRWCRPRWLKLDRPTLAASGAVSIDLAAGRVDSVAGRAGDHPWAPSPPKSPPA